MKDSKEDAQTETKVKETKTVEDSSVTIKVNKKYVAPALLLVGIIAIAAASFYVGKEYQKEHMKVTFPVPAGMHFTERGLRSEGIRAGNRNNRIAGKVTAISATSISVADNLSETTKTLAITNNTEVISDGQNIKVSDIKTGNTVMVVPDSSDASKAFRILVNPATASTQPTPDSATN